MQLFITSFQKSNKNILITEERVIYQCRKVLRYKHGDQFRVQSWEFRVENQLGVERYLVKILDFDDRRLECMIEETKQVELKSSPDVSLFVALPNKIEKAELIVQKLAEIGVNQIVFRKAERSVLTDFSVPKIERLQKIILEAVEQSRGVRVPRISVQATLSIPAGARVHVFDQPLSPNPKVESPKLWNSLVHTSTGSVWQLIVWIVGPEGGLSERDYQKFGEDYQVTSLGGTVLRMETAAIVGGWMLKNQR